jgi:serine protease Do
MPGTTDRLLRLFQEPTPMVSPSPGQKTSRLSFLRRPVLTGTAAIAAIVAAFGAGHLLGPTASEAQVIRPRAPAAATTLPSFADIVERVAPAVVSTRPAGEMPNLDGLPPQWRRFFEEQQRRRGEDGQEPEEARGGGSGFFIRADGYIVTNNHVVEDATEITATLKDGRELKATVVGVDERTDLAVLKVDGSNYPYVQFDPSARIRVGDWVIAIGNPFGLGGTATAGIVSAVGRDIRSPNESNISDFIQLDAPINPGNSGGPTFDLQGRVIGVNTAIFSRSGGNVGIGFAVPASMAERVTSEIITSGRVSYGWLGVSIGDLNRELAESFGLSEGRGAVVGTVSPGSPAARAGLRRGDAITSMDGTPVESASDLTRRIGRTAVGSTVRLEVVNASGQRRTVPVVIAARPSEQELAQQQDGAGSSGSTTPGRPPGEAEAADAPLGLAASPLTPQARERLRIGADDAGLLITGVDRRSEAYRRGIRPGDALLEANGRELRTVADFAAAVAAARTAGRTSVSVYVQSQQGGAGFVPLPLAQPPATEPKGN